MSRTRSPKAIRRLDTAKFAIFILFCAIFIVLFVMRSCQNKPAQTGSVATAVPTYTAEAQVIRPVLISPKTGGQVGAGEVEVRGTGAPSTTLQIVIDQNVVTKTQVSAAGD